MRIVKAGCRSLDQDVIDAAVEVLESGGLVVAPTDTLYGLLADPLDEQAFEKVYRVKGRDPSKPLPILLGESHHALLLVVPSPLFWKLAIKFWPGPLTIVEKRRGDLPGHLARWGSLGVRLPRCPLVREIARNVGGLLVGTSANRSGWPPPVEVGEAVRQLGDKVDLYIDGGRAGLGVPSTVVDLSAGRPVVVRPGGVPIDEVEEVIGSLKG
ncbi:MAG: threonylcarbamoyl-AMP synthase [Desulfurococcales archaeon]|nr:threonylcarbamoyl-AMP synthase [Desulfurococcales archaeon]